MEKKLGFQCYQIMTKNGPIPCHKDATLDDHIMFAINTTDIRYGNPPPDTRSKFRKFTDDWKRRFSHAWYALKGYDCD